MTASPSKQAITLNSSVANSFGGGLGASQTVTATFIECSSGAGSFNANISTGTNGGTYIGCTAGNDSFNGKNISYVAEKCTAGNNSFGYSSTSVNPILFNAAKLSYCKAGINSFGFSSWLDSATEFKYCEGGNLCFGVSNGGPGQTTAAKFYHCKGGDFCFGVGVQGPRGTGPGPAIAAEFYNCVGGNKCFGVGNGIELAGVCVNCTAGNWSFGSSENNPLGAWATATGKFYNCRAGNNSFGASSGSNGGAVASGQFYKCVAGAGSFGSNNGASTSGDDSFASGYFEDCTGGYRSFAGHGRAFKSGFFLRCIVLGDSPSTPVIDDLGALIENGVMEDCVWRVNNATAKALLVQNTSGGTPAPRVLGGKYIAGSGANFAIGSGGGSPQAVIAQIRSNGGSSGLIESTITNLAASGTIDAADNFTYTGL